jgi:diguanylate cyclase (GGDEF)-like protein
MTARPVNGNPRDRLAAAPQAVLRAAFALLLLIFVAAGLNAVFGVGDAQIDELMRTWASSAVYVIAAALVLARAIVIRESRTAWILIAAGLAFYCVGNLLWTLWLENAESAPIPSLADAFWLSLYPASYAGLVLLARRGRSRAPAGVWLDGIVAGLGMAALGAAVVVRPVLDSASGSTLAVATNLAYPVADLILAGLVVGLMALRGWRLDAKWASLGAAFLVLCVADILYLLQVASGAHEASLMPNLIYMSAVGLLALAAWQPARTRPALRVDGWPVLLVPGAIALAAVGLMLHDHFERLDPLTLALAVLTILAALIRTALSFRDLRSLAETRREATTDELTSLPNRRLFLRTVHDTIAKARAAQESAALLIIDLDEFKALNDALGHHAGDELLRQLGPRLGDTVRSTDLLARIGGDEFGLLLAAPTSREAALKAASRIREALRRPFEVQGLHLHVSASVGIALFPFDADTGHRLVQHADAAMYRAKARGTASEVYSPEFDDHSRDALELASELSDAISDDQLELHFQPIADVHQRRIVGIEALVRWNHPTRGLIPPSDFIPVAEQSGLMRNLTRWIIDSALECARTLRDQGHDLRLSVNVSAPDLLDAEFPNEVAAALAEHGVKPSALTLEVTETSIMSDRVRVSDVLRRLAEVGVNISLDDFGTGYSSLLHLKTLPVSELKIDRGFVAGMATSATDWEIVRATIQLAHNLGLSAVAEGVEDETAWQALCGLGCEMVQGYYLARPLSPGDLHAYLAARPLSIEREIEPYTGLLNPAL